MAYSVVTIGHVSWYPICMDNTKNLDTLLIERDAINQSIADIKKRHWREQKRANRLTLEELRRILYYDPITGILTWLIRRNGHGGCVVGKPAGSLRQHSSDTWLDGGYIQIVIDQRVYRAHRLAWWFMTGTPPPKGIDVEHKNRDRADNRWENLRLATRSQNNCNAKTRRDNRSGVKGVHPNARAYGKPWFARITMNKRIIHLGFFDTIEEAAEARRLAEIKHHEEFRRQ